MNKQLKQFEPFLNEKKVSINIYTCKINNENKNFDIDKMPLHTISQDNIKKKFVSNLKEYLKEKELLNFSSYDDRNNVIYKYDLPIIKGRLEDLSNFNSTKIESKFNGDFSKIYGLIFEVGNSNNSIICYKQNYAINAFGENQLLGNFRNKAFKLLATQVYRLNPFADIIIYNKDPYILNLNVLEKNFGIEESLKARALSSIEIIAKLGILENTKTLKDSVTNLSFSRKLMKIKHNSPVLTLKKENIIRFTKEDDQLKNNFSYSENGLIVLDSIKAKNLFLKLLNDDFLHSKLTGKEYIAKAKDEGKN